MLGNWLGNMLTVEEYMALETTKTAANFEGISKAKASKPRRQQKDDVEVAEAPVCREGAEDSGAGAGCRTLSPLSTLLSPAHERICRGPLGRVLQLDLRRHLARGECTCAQCALLLLALTTIEQSLPLLPLLLGRLLLRSLQPSPG